MAAPDHSQLGLGDGMVLVVASGLSLTAFTVVDDGLFGSQRFFFGVFRGWPEPTLVGWTNRAAGLVAMLLVLVGGWTLALPALTLRWGRRDRHRLGRGPGLTACLAAMVAMLAWAGIAGLVISVRTRVELRAIPPRYWSVSPIFDGLLAAAGLAVAAVWGVQVATRRWHPQRNAFDRLGRALGLMWLAVGAVFAAKLLIPW